MSFTTNNAVLYNVNQNFPESAGNGASKERARNNIGAASAAALTTETQRATDAEKAAKSEVVAGSGISVASSTGSDGQNIYTVTNTSVFTQVNADWTASSGVSQILHKPTLATKAYGGSNVEIASLVIDADDPDGFTDVMCDNVSKGKLVIGPYATLLNSGVNGVGDSSTPVYIDGNGQFATCAITPGGAKRSHTAELYFHHSQDGDHYNVRNVKNYCINHVAVTGHFGDICYIEIEAPTLDGTGEEYDYVVVFDCVNSSGSTTHVVVQNADPEIFTYPLDSTSSVVQITQTLVYFDGSVRSQIEVLGGRFTVHSY